MTTAQAIRPIPLPDIRKKITITGIVQGVGFRPFIYNLACQHQVKGFVRNLGGSVEIEVQSTAAKVSHFLQEISQKAPPMSLIEKMAAVEIPTLASTADFEILNSSSTDNLHKAISPDMATCDDCLEELFDPANRRYRYPFINCTNCGPRFTIIEKLPYDRPFTTMAEFEMCQLCSAEYTDPTNRRFHAQPNACTTCGPSLTFVSKTENGNCTLTDDALGKTVELLANGRLVAVKGLGGFHIICDAESDQAITALRKGKRRTDKPFAVMMTDLDMVSKFCCLNDREIKLLSSPEKPIVLLRLLKDTTLKTLAPGNAFLGVMLPYTPIHHLLMSALKRPLVCTSGNVSEEPIATDNEEAITNLANIVDGYLIHNRKILSRYDDSVITVFDNEALLIRRSRGYAPKSVSMPMTTSKQVLALGAQLKNTFCLYKNAHAYISQHIGDLENLETLEHLDDALARMIDLFDVQPEIIACDMHLDYLSTQFAVRLSMSMSLPLIKVQHHHAHIVSCMVENNLRGPVIGVAFDGAGFGPDGTVWGGEFLISHYDRFERVAHLSTRLMPGGHLAIRQPWRMALSYLQDQQFDGAKTNYLNICRVQHGEQAVQFALQQLQRGINSPPTSSAGRLFDAAAAALNIRHIATFEGQAAIELEALGHQWTAATQVEDTYPFTIDTSACPMVIETGQIIPHLISEQLAGITNVEASYRFHLTIAGIISQTCEELKNKTGIKQICLSGGVFQNRLLLDLTLKALRKQNLEVFLQRVVPTNDGGISLGQAVIAASQANALREIS